MLPEMRRLTVRSVSTTQTWQSRPANIMPQCQQHFAGVCTHQAINLCLSCLYTISFFGGKRISPVSFMCFSISGQGIKVCKKTQAEHFVFFNHVWSGAGSLPKVPAMQLCQSQCKSDGKDGGLVHSQRGTVLGSDKQRGKLQSAARAVYGPLAWDTLALQENTAISEAQLSWLMRVLELTVHV